MKDIARIVGVSQSTVSRILNNTTFTIQVSEKTRSRVLAAAREHGFRANPLARGLRGARTMLLGAVIRDITDPFFAMVIDVLASQARDRGYSVVLGHARARADEALALTAVLEARHCDAIFLLGDFRQQPALLADLKNGPVPVIALWHGSGLRGFHSVSVDNRAGVTAVLEHLAILGHERIGFLSTTALGDIRERRAAYEERTRKLSGHVPRGYIQTIENSMDAVRPALERMLAAPQRPTAVVAATDVLAIGLCHAAAHLGMHIPSDLSVAGFDDIPLARAGSPPLTTVHMPVREMVKTAVELATAADLDPSDPTNQTFQPCLVVRESTAQPSC